MPTQRRTRLQGWAPRPSSTDENTHTTHLPNHPSDLAQNIQIPAFQTTPDTSNHASSATSFHTFPQDDEHTDADSTSSAGAWVPRPANCFIIFRSQYSRIHSRANTGREGPSDKSLSKRASEAWKAMSKEERNIFARKAEEVKEEHMRKNPDYRFHPRKKRLTGRRKSSFPNKNILLAAPRSSYSPRFMVRPSHERDDSPSSSPTTTSFDALTIGLPHSHRFDAPQENLPRMSSTPELSSSSSSPRAFSPDTASSPHTSPNISHYNHLYMPAPHHPIPMPVHSVMNSAPSYIIDGEIAAHACIGHNWSESESSSNNSLSPGASPASHYSLADDQLPMLYFENAATIASRYVHSQFHDAPWDTNASALPIIPNAPAATYLMYSSPGQITPAPSMGVWSEIHPEDQQMADFASEFLHFST